MKRFLLYHIMYVIFFKVENRERERLDSYKSNVLDNDDTIGIPAWLRWLTWRLIAMMPYPCWVRAYELIERPELFSYNAHEIARRYWGNECAVSSRVCYSSMAVKLPSLYIHIYMCVCVRADELTEPWHRVRAEWKPIRQRHHRCHCRRRRRLDDSSVVTRSGHHVESAQGRERMEDCRESIEWGYDC